MTSTQSICEFYKNRYVFITGATGFVGKVWTINISFLYTTYVCPKLKLNILTDLYNFKQFRLSEEDIKVI